MATELGAYYISLVPTAHNISSHIARTLAPAQGIADNVGAESGGRFSNAFGRATAGVGHALATALKVGTVAAGAAIAAAGTVGVKTAAQLETAQISFTTMLGSAEKARSFLGDLKTFAAKTPFDLPGLQESAQSLISIGIDSKKVLPIMTTLGNVTSGMGTGSVGIKRATVALQQMNAAQKISAEDLNQLRDAGIPVYDLLTAATGKSTAEIAEMRDKGQLGREELELLMDALETGRGFERFNGLMDAQSQSLDGLWSTLKDTFSVGMADIIAPLMPMLKVGLGGSISFLSDFVIPRGTAAMVEFTGGIAAFGAAWKANDGDVTSSGFPGFMERVANAARDAQAWLGQLDFSSVQGFFESLHLDSLAPAFESIWSSLKDLAPAAMAFGSALAAATPDFLTTGIELLSGALGFLSDHVDWIVDHIPLLVGIFIAWKVAQMGVNLVTAASIPLMTAANVARAVAAVAELKLVNAQYRALTAGAASNTIAEVGLVTRLRATVATVAHNGAVLASAAATRVASAAQWLWNAAMSANPIALVIKGLALAAAGIVWFFTQTEVGRTVFTNVWNWIKVTVGGFVNWLISWVVPTWNAVFGALSAAATWLWGIIVTAWNAIGGVIVGAWQNFIWPALQNIWNFITVTLGPVWAWLSRAVEVAWFYIRRAAWNAFLWLYWNVFRPFKEWQLEHQVTWEDVKNKVVEVWNLVVAKISDAWNNWIFPILQGAWAFLTNVIIPVWNTMWTVISFVWNAAVAIISWAWNNIIWPLLQGAWWFLTNIIIPVWNALWTVISFVWNKAVEVISWAWNVIIWPLLQGAWRWINETLIPIWNTLKDKISEAWTKISDAISGTWTWIKDNIFTPMSNFLTVDVPKMWEDSTKFIGDMWNKLKNIAKEPIKWVINSVINDGIVGTFNGIADKLPGVGKLDKIDLPDGWARGGVLPGYRTTKSDDVLTPMRSGEGVLVPEAVRGIGASTLHALNAAGNRGGVAAVRALVGNQPGYAKGGLIRPASGPITSGYRGPGRPDHDGVDIGAPMGANIVAAGDGKVVDAGWHNWGGGNHVDIQHAGNLRTEYYHMSQILARVGQQVSKGDVIGKVGSTGNSTGPHLHYEVHIGDGLHSSDGVNPMAWLDGGGEFDPNGSNAGGGGGFNPFASIIDGIAGMVKGAFPGGGQMVDTAVGLAKKVGNDMVAWIGDKFGGIFDVVDNVAQGAKAVGSSVQVSAWATEALMKTGNFDPWNLASLVRRIMQESGGDPRAVNNWDSNAAAGIPSKGLMQTIGPTFEQYRDRGLPNDIFDPVSNIVAAINYTRARYGNLRGGWDRKGGYALGGIVPTLFDDGGLLHNVGGPQVIDHQRRKPDAVLTDSEWSAMYDIASNSGQEQAIYVQNPFTGDYLIAETESHAVDATGDVLQGTLRRSRRGGKYAGSRRG